MTAMLASTPPEHAFALDVDGLLDPAISFFSFRADGELLGVGAIKRLDAEHAEIKSMHTAAAARGRGVGRAMLAFVERTLREETPVRQMWCNARVPAIGFYERLGWRVVSERFEIPTAGPHVRMTKLL